MPEVGRWVRLARLGIEALPEESLRVFRFCLGRIYRIVEIDGQGLCVLDVSDDVDHRFGGFRNDIRVEHEHLEVFR